MLSDGLFLFAQSSGETLWFPAPASTGASDVDRLFFFILAISTFFFVLIVGLMATFVIRYRTRPGHFATASPSHNTLLELIWSIVPAGLVAVIFVWGFFGYVNARTPPEDSYEIQVVARKWSWSFIYPNGHIDNNLHVPANRPVTLVMSSDDVIHSLFVPAFRVKMDVVPGRYTKTWFEATAVGDHVLFCAEYCGTGHSTMNARVVVHRSDEFKQWLEKAGQLMDTLSPVEKGKLLYTRRGCIQCHSLDGSAKSGPTFQGTYGSQQQMTSGEMVTVDENYLRQSILEPQARIRAGYRAVMPTYAGQLSDDEVSALIQFIKSPETATPSSPRP